MATTITMPQLGETVTEGTVAQWLKQPGERVEKYEAFVEVSTDKVNAEVPSPVSGTIRELIVHEGETVPTGAPIAIIDEVGAAIAAEPVKPAQLGVEPSSYGAPGSGAGVAAGNASNGSASGNGRTARSAEPATASAALRHFSPAVRRLAREHHIDATSVKGTGLNGRVTAEDIMAAANAGPSAALAAAVTHLPTATAAPPPSRPSTYNAPVPGETIPLTQARKIIAARMVASKNTAPHAWTMTEVDVTDLWRRRMAEKDAFERDFGVKLTLLPFFVRAVVESLTAFPLMNARFTDDGIVVHREAHVGIAAAVDGNLVVPVVRDAGSLSVRGLALAIGALVDRARRGKLGADDLRGGTFTVNTTGANGSILSAPILNAGQAGIVTMEAVVKRPVVVGDDAIAVRSMMNVCLSIDHRVVDGAIASGFLADLRRRLEKASALI